MKKLVYFYLKPNDLVQIDSYNELFKGSLILYLIVVFIFSEVSFYMAGNDLVSSSPFSNNTTLYIVRTIGLLLKQPVQVLFFTIGSYLLLKLFLNITVSFMDLFKIVFVAFNVVIISYSIEIFNLLSGYKLLDIFKYSVNDIFIKNQDCSQYVASFTARINSLFVLSTIYCFYLIRVRVDHSKKKLIFLLILSISLTLFLFSSIPSLLLSIFNFANTK